MALFGGGKPSKSNDDATVEEIRTGESIPNSKLRSAGEYTDVKELLTDFRRGLDD
jgi:hypothetical protein